MNNAIYVTIVFTDDYEALYIDGMLVFSEHRLDLFEVLKSIVGYQLLNVSSYYIDLNILEEKYACDFPMCFANFDLEDFS